MRVLILATAFRSITGTTPLRVLGMALRSECPRIAAPVLGSLALEE